MEAWWCAGGTPFGINVFTSSGIGKVSFVPLDSSSPSWNNVPGQQPPGVEAADLLPATKDDDMGNRPIYSFTTTYNRTVLVPDNLFQGIPPPPRPDNSSVAWLCTFNDTIIEGFIYPSITTRTGGGYSQRPIFPYDLKFNERRFPNGTAPYCEQRIFSEGRQLISNVTNTQILQLREPTTVPSTENASAYMSSRRRRQQMPTPNICLCEWVFKTS